MKRFVIVVLLLLVAAGVAAFVLRRKPPANSEQNGVGPPKSVKVDVGDIDLRVSTTGKVISNLDVDIKSKASGQIIKLPFDVSDTVKAGDLLAELDPIDELRNVSLQEAQLSSSLARLSQAKEQYRVALIELDTGTSMAQAELASARTRNRDAQARLSRQEDLFAKGLVSREELDAVRTEASAAAASLQQAEARVAETLTLPRTVQMRLSDIQLNESAVKTAQVQLDNARQRLTETKIYAPMDGVVTARTVQTGQIIASGISNVGGGTTLMTLSDLSRVFISANVDESDIGKVKEGQFARITADAYPGKRFRGKVVRIATKGLNQSNVVTFEVKIEIEGEGKELLKPEMTANVEIQADRHEEVLILPNEAVQFGKEGYFVEVPDGQGKTKRQPVVTGLTDGINTEISEGLKEGDEVLISSAVRSRWAQGDQSRGQSFNRGVQMMGFRASGMGGGRRGGGR